MLGIELQALLSCCILFYLPSIWASEPITTHVTLQGGREVSATWIPGESHSIEQVAKDFCVEHGLEKGSEHHSGETCLTAIANSLRLKAGITLQILESEVETLSFETLFHERKQRLDVWLNCRRQSEILGASLRNQLERFLTPYAFITVELLYNKILRQVKEAVKVATFPDEALAKSNSLYRSPQSEEATNIIPMDSRVLLFELDNEIDQETRRCRDSSERTSNLAVQLKNIVTSNLSEVSRTSVYDIFRQILRDDDYMKNKAKSSEVMHVGVGSGEFIPEGLKVKKVKTQESLRSPEKYIYGDRCDIQRIDARNMTRGEFARLYQKKRVPVMLRGLFDLKWPAFKDWLRLEIPNSELNTNYNSYNNTERNSNYGSDIFRHRVNPAFKHRIFSDYEESTTTLPNLAVLQSYMRFMRKTIRGKMDYLMIGGMNEVGPPPRNFYTPLRSDHFKAGTMSNEVLENILHSYDIPKIFEPDLSEICGLEGMWQKSAGGSRRWILVSASGSGSAWHVDPFNTSAWNALLTGTKQWALYAPGAHHWPPGLKQFELPKNYDILVKNPDQQKNITKPFEILNDWSDENVGLQDWGTTSPLSAEEHPFQYFNNTLPNLNGKDRPLLCTQRPGELIFLPTGWWHAVLNTQDTVAITENFVSKTNINDVMAEFRKRPAGSLPRKCLDKMRIAYPHLVKSWS
eukprot:GSMAST32.ASY1.ANO1.240.1 assembled CDS